MIRRSQIQTHMEVLDQAGHLLGHVERLLADGTLCLSKRSPKPGSRTVAIPMAWVDHFTAGRLVLDRAAEDVVPLHH